MPRLYVSNDSYPELRGVRPGWARSRIWWRAIGRACRHGDFRAFVAVQALVLVGSALAAALPALVFSDAAGRAAGVAGVAAGLLLFCYLQVSWGGDMMRRHLRAVSRTARYACPACGHSLFGHLASSPQHVRCPECGARIEAALFAPPFKVPARFRAFPPWRRRPLSAPRGRPL